MFSDFEKKKLLPIKKIACLSLRLEPLSEIHSGRAGARGEPQAAAETRVVIATARRGLQKD